MPPQEEAEKFRPDEFMIRPCHVYNEEFYECDGHKARFHQYFVYGDYLDCSQWMKDFQSCKRWKATKDEKAYEELIESEKKRRLERLKGHYQNDVWKKRDKPPESWSSPLPDWIEKRNQNSYLKVKAEALKSGSVNDLDIKIYNACSIL